MQEALDGVDPQGLSEQTARRLARATSSAQRSTGSPSASATRQTSAVSGTGGPRAFVSGVGPSARSRSGRGHGSAQSATRHGSRHRAVPVREGARPPGTATGAASLADAVLGTETRHRSPSGKSLREVRQPSAVYTRAMGGVRGSSRPRSSGPQGRPRGVGHPRVGQGMASLADVHSEVLRRGRSHGPVPRGGEATPARGVRPERSVVADLVERVWEEPDEFA